MGKDVSGVVLEQRVQMAEKAGMRAVAGVHLLHDDSETEERRYRESKNIQSHVMIGCWVLPLAVPFVWELIVSPTLCSS